MIPDRGSGTELRAEIDQEIIVVTFLEVEIEIEMDGCKKSQNIIK